ncbi:MAG: hypothetical protein HRT61_03350 [Ekhidna sp.]|nr:hypothetical protein [Ekhidna sp.]
MRNAILILYSLILHVSHAQYRFDHLSGEDGLSQNSVNDIIEDSERFMWLATQDGLNRYDGYDFKVYNLNSDPPLSSNFVWSLVEDPSGNIWMASSVGATRLNWRNGSSTRFYSDITKKMTSTGNQVSRVILKGDTVIIAYDGMGSVKLHHQAYSEIDEISLDTTHLHYAADTEQKRYLYDEFRISDKLVVISMSHLLINDEQFAYPEGFTVNNFQGDCYLYQNGFFLGTSGGLLYFDLIKKKFSQTCLDQSVSQISQSPDAKNLWIGTANGIQVYDPSSMTCGVRIETESASYSLSSSSISSIYRASDGIYWIGTANGGINLYNPLKDNFRFLNKEGGLNGKPVWDVLKIQENLFIASDQGFFHIMLYDKDQQTFLKDEITLMAKVNHSLLSEERITTLFEIDENRLLIGTHSGILASYDMQKRSITQVERLQGSPVISGIVERRDTFYVTTHSGLRILDQDLREVMHWGYDFDPDKYKTSYFLSAFKARDGSLWFGANNGFYIYDTLSELTHIPFDEDDLRYSPAHYFITGFFEDDEHKIWMSTFGGGVSCFDRETSKFMHYREQDGLIHNTCSSIEGYKNKVFVSTNAGLSVIDRSSGSITNYAKEDGIISSEFAIASSFRFDDEIYFGGLDGITMFNPTSLNEFQLEEPLITELEVNYEPDIFSKISNNQLFLEPSDKIFTLSFSGMSYQKGSLMKYAYRMKGFEDDWVFTNAGNRKATYSLGPGNYLFEVKTILDGRESDVSQLQVIRLPAFYQTWWFITLSVVFIILLIVAISRYFSYQALKDRLRALEVQQKIQKERERISRDLHDNVGSQITYIATTLDGLSVGDHEEVRELGDFTRATMRQLRETIWVINRDKVTIAELQAKIIDYLSEVLKYRPEIRHEVKIPKDPIELNPERAINIFRIIQEAVNNVLKHAKASTIRIEWSGDTNATLTISDDGIGFDGKEKLGHFGLLNLRSRASDLGAAFAIESVIGKGTVISISNL